MLCHLLVMTAYNTVHGASGRHRLDPVPGECLHEGGDAPACAVVASRFIQGHDGLCDVFWRVGRVALGSGGPFLGPSGMLCIRAIPPLLEPTFRAGQVPTDVLDLVSSKRGVNGLFPALFFALGHDGCLWELRMDVPMEHVFSLSWHNACRVSGFLWTFMMNSRCTRHIWRHQIRSKQEQELVSNQSDGAGITT